MSPKTRKSTPFTPFSPKKRESRVKGIYIEVEPELHERIKVASAQYDLSMKSFILQALEFAMDNMEPPN